MRVAQKQGDEDEANCTCLNSFNLINLYSVLLVIGVQLTRLIESNTLTKEADGDALAFFESYAATIKSHNHCATAAIVYLRVLFLYLEKGRSW